MGGRDRPIASFACDVEGRAVGAMKKDDLLRRLEERLARGEISERTYLEIKTRYDAIPDEPEESESHAHEAEGHAEHVDHAHEAGEKVELERLIEQTVESAMGQAAASLEAAFASRNDVATRVEELNRRLEKAFGKFGAHVDSGGKLIVVRGAGVLSGDQSTEKFRAAGSCRVAGNLRAEEAHISGSCVVEGDCLSEEFHASGKAEIQGGVKAKEFRVAGKASVGKDVTAEDVSVSGKVAIRGSILDAKDVALSGAIDVGGWVRTKDFTSKGQFQIGEGIEAKDVEIVLAGKSSVPTIRADDVTVRRGDRRGELAVGLIEAENVDLESTRATLVKGRDVRVGPFCTIDAVEAEELEVHETSTVKERRPPTAGT